MNISFENKVALVTGAGSGLGLATAKAFAESGASVVLADWNEGAVRSVAEGLAARGHKALAVHCDVADDAQVEAMVEQTVATFGRLDAAYNNAGVQNIVAEAADASREDFDRVMSINLRGVWSCMKFELRQMLKQGSGAIVNCSSIGGLVGGPKRGTYQASKHGVLWAHQKRGAGLCRKGHPDQCRLPGHHPYFDARQDDGDPGRRPQRDVERRAHRSAWPPRGDCERRSLALQFGRKPDGRSCARGGWRVYDTLSKSDNRRSATVPQRVHQQCKSCRGLASAGIVEVVARKGRTPVLKHPLEAAFVDVGLHQAFR